MIDDRQQMNIVIAGHVDHGKSTIIGRLLADTDSLPDGKLEAVRENCRRNSKPFEYAFLLDALKDEQAQGITIDSARVFFSTPLRDYIIIDAPGHIEFLKNMVTGASRAEAALLVIDANEGVRENSRRHGYMISMLGIKQMAVLVNKMDLVGYSEAIYRAIVSEYSEFLKGINVKPRCFLPVSGFQGDSISKLTAQMPWYKGKTVLEVLDDFQKEKPQKDKAFRMPVQGVYKFTRFGDDRRIVAGTVETGELRIGDEVVFLPSGKRSRVKTIESFNTGPQSFIAAGDAAGFTLDEQIYITRGEIAVKAREKAPKVSTRLRVNLFWMGKDPFVKNKDYKLKIGTINVPVRIEEIIKIIDASDLNLNVEKDRVERHDVAECLLKVKTNIAFDIAEEIEGLSRFVIVDNYEIRGGGIIREELDDEQSWIRDKVYLRNTKWIRGDIMPKQRAERYNQKAKLILITGQKDAARKELAKALEKRLFEEGKLVYYLGLGSLLYGVDADIKSEEIGTENGNRTEHFRRLAEVANIMLDSGMIMILSAADMTQEDLEIIKVVVNSNQIDTIWLGDDVTTDLQFDEKLSDLLSIQENLEKIKSRLQETGVIFSPW
ncbi:MAG: adenylyl-sulfate kinase [Candidatus Marinimicrobia bacterium]|nr:adenylyl-sulfate kinase [Candidatus Neomarinimicrobiota bacterium]